MKHVLCLFIAGSLSIALGAQESLAPFSPPSGSVVIQERSDFSRYEDGRYVGHSYREARLDLSVENLQGPGLRYYGEALVLEETLRDQRIAAKRIDAALGVDFSQLPGAAPRFTIDEGYPILRGLPSTPSQAILQGGRWTGEGTVVVRPRQGKNATRIAVLVEYQYIGPTRYGGRDALSIRARYAIRYNGTDRLGDAELRSASGGRTADITIDAEDGSTIFIRENCDETFTYGDGSSVRLKGFILHFHKGSLQSDRIYIASLLRGNAEQGSDVPDIAAAAEAGAFEIAVGERGVVMLLFDLRFVADSDELLSSDRRRLDAIAMALLRLDSKTFLVEGHSADLGRPAGQYELSERRARRVVDEMVARGIPAARFVYRGLGADRPIAANDSEEQRARNRRVEITILD